MTVLHTLRRGVLVLHTAHRWWNSQVDLTWPGLGSVKPSLIYLISQVSDSSCHKQIKNKRHFTNTFSTALIPWEQQLCHTYHTYHFLCLTTTVSNDCFIPKSCTLLGFFFSFSVFSTVDFSHQSVPCRRELLMWTIYSRGGQRLASGPRETIRSSPQGNSLSIFFQL